MPRPTHDPLNPTLSGAEYRRTHKHTVIGILGDRAPNVSSRGSRFYNVDRWTLRIFVGFMCDWAHNNPECIPTRNDIAAWVLKANQTRIGVREIVIANTPDKLPQRTAMALIGGAVHEALHTDKSCLRNLTTDEMCDIILARWALVPDWSKFYVLLQDWNNLVEDIRIERCGRQEYPGIEVKMHDLQDFILQQEAQGLEDLRSHQTGKGPIKRGAISIIAATFRDIGLGYNTFTQQDALAKYKVENPQAVEFVRNGPLSDLLRQSIRLGPKDDTACLSIAMDVIAVMYAHSKQPDPANDEQCQDHQPGESHKVACPSCGAPGKKLVVRPKADGRGGKVPGKGILTCSVCGHQEEVNLQKGQKGQKGQKADPKDTPRFEGFDKPEQNDQDDGDADSGDESEQGSQSSSSDGGESSEKKSKSKSKGSAGGDEDDESDSGEPTGGSAGTDDENEEGAGAGSSHEEEDDGDGDGEEDDGDGDGDGDDDGDGDGDGDDDGEEGDGGDGGEDDGEDEGQGGALGDTGDDFHHDNEDKGGSGGAGGHNYQNPQIAGNDWASMLNEGMEDADEGTKLLDNNSALAEAVEEAQDKADEADKLKSGEARWCPYDPSLDEVLIVGPSAKGRQFDALQADALYESVKGEASFLRARLRQIVRAMEMVSVIHGLPKGRRLSPRFLVESRVALMAGERPKRPYWQRDEQIDTSLAAAIVIDESGSMSSILKDATRVLVAITEPLDALGCPVMAIGFRDGEGYSPVRSPGAPETRTYHRTSGVTYDIFKQFHEPFRSVKWRFANTRATGGTPMADGIQYGLRALNYRLEGHRVLFVVTDGQPNSGHLPIIRHQIRLAKEAGIHVIGVGLGSGAEYVRNVFPDYVWTKHISDMPKALIAKLNELVDVRASKRGRQMQTA